MRSVLRSKIHNATVTEANPDYVGSITIDAELMERAGLWEHEKVLVAAHGGARLETYVIRGEPGSGEICMNGPAAHHVRVGERVVIMGFELTDVPVTPRVVLVDGENRFLRMLEEAPATVA